MLVSSTGGMGTRPRKH